MKKNKKKEKSVFESSTELAQEDLKPKKRTTLKSFKKNKKKGIVCRYCKYFYQAEKRRLERSGSSFLDFRECKHINKEVMDLNDGCEEFVLNTVFWCDKWDCFLDIKMCANRRKNSEEGCVRCTQGRVIESLTTQ